MARIIEGKYNAGTQGALDVELVVFDKRASALLSMAIDVLPCLPSFVYKQGGGNPDNFAILVMELLDFGMKLAAVRPVEITQVESGCQSWTWVSTERMEVDIIDGPAQGKDYCLQALS